MVRVALEIALDRNYKKVLWWPDFWHGHPALSESTRSCEPPLAAPRFSDHDKREYFKERRRP